MLKLNEVCPFLFKNKKSNGNHVSQTATFDPVVALNSKNAWVSSATPSSAVTPKKLIISRELLFDHPNVNEWIAWISWLQHLDIPVYLCTKTSPRFRLLSKETKFAELIQYLDLFKTEDYKELAEKMALARDECVVPSETERGQFIQFLRTIDNKYNKMPENFIKKVSILGMNQCVCFALEEIFSDQNIPSWFEDYILTNFQNNGEEFKELLCSVPTSIIENIPQAFKTLAQKHRDILLKEFYQEEGNLNIETLFILFPDEKNILQKVESNILKKENGYELLTILYLNVCKKFNKKTIFEMVKNFKFDNFKVINFLINQFSLHRFEELMRILIEETDAQDSFFQNDVLTKKVIQNCSNEVIYSFLNNYIIILKKRKNEIASVFFDLVNLLQDKEDLINYVLKSTKEFFNDLSRKNELLENLYQCVHIDSRKKVIREFSLDPKKIPIDSIRALLTYLVVNDGELPEVISFNFGGWSNSEYTSHSIDSFWFLRHFLIATYSKPATQKIFIEKAMPFYKNDFYNFEACLCCCAEENISFFNERFIKEYNNKYLERLSEDLCLGSGKLSWKHKDVELSEFQARMFLSTEMQELRRATNENSSESSGLNLYEEESKDSITEIYIDVDFCLKLYSMILNKIINSEFPSVSVVKIFGSSTERTEKIVEAIIKHCPQIQIIECEGAIQKKGDKDNVIYQKKYIIWTPNKTIENNIETSNINSQDQHDENEDILFICKDSSDTEISVDGGVNLGGSYIKHETGKALNKPKDQLLPRVRTCVYSAAIEDKEIKLTKYVPEKFETFLIVKKIENKDLSEYKSRPPEKDGVYYQFSQTVPSGKWTRLLSIDANEDLDSYIAPLDRIEFAKGDDGFVYAFSKEAIEIEYVLKTSMTTNELDQSHKAKIVIEEFKNHEKYKKIATEQASKITGSAEQWLEDLFAGRKGACQERCLAVWHQILKKHPELTKSVRLIRIDNSHVRLEIIIDGIVYQEDLGGGAAQEIFQRKNENVTKKINTSPFEKKLESLQYQGLKQLFVKELKKITDESEFLKYCYQNNEKFLRTLIINDRQNHNEAINFLVKVFHETGKTFKVIDKFEDINLNDNKYKILIQKNETPIMGSVTEPTPDYFIIDWNTITEEQRVQANHIFAETKLNIISFCKNKPTDASFLRRHDEELIDITGLDVKLAPVKIENPECFEIDLRAYLDWEKQLFAPVVLIENKPVWHKNLLVEKLQEAVQKDLAVEIKITNVPQDALPAIKKMIQRACAEGSFSYLGFEIPLSKNIKISVDEKRLDFSKFEKMDTGLIKNSHDGKFEIINSARFELLLQQKDIPNGIYTQKPGLVELRKGGNLQINITSDLSEEQWYALLDECLLHKVELACHLDKGVNVPVAVQNRFTIKENINPVIEMTESVINEDGFEIVIHVEDCCAQDFLGHIDYTIKDNQFYFNVRECEFLEKLKEGKKILLKGEFSTHLWQELEPLRRDPAKYLQERFPNEIFETPVIEFWREPPVNKIEPVIYEEPETENNEINFEKAKENADSFIKNRTDKAMDTLKKHSMLELIGESGVGKSSLIKEINDRNLAKVYRGLSDIPKWATEKSEIPKILFIDESNIENFHLTTFEPLKNSSGKTGARRIFWEGVFYELDESCLVVLARNPCEYGGGRNEQKLTEDNRVPKIIMHDFPFDYMYAQILKPLYRGNDEKEFNQFCYQLLLTYDPKKMTVRGLQEDVLKKYAPTKSKCSFWGPKNSLLDSNYLLFSSVQPLRSEIISFLNVRKNSPNGLGLNLYMVEGPPGVGKSALIVNILKTQKIPYVLIKASLSVQEKIEQIKSAIKNNQAVIIDELNSCIDDGLEKFLNEVLTSPESKLIMFATCNSMSEEGRSKFSPAIRKRSYYRYMQHPTVEDFKALIHSKIDKLSSSDFSKMEDAYLLFLHNKDNKEEIINKMSQDLAVLVKNEPTANLQRILEKFEDLLMIYAPITLGKTETNEETRAFTIF